MSVETTATGPDLDHAELSRRDRSHIIHPFLPSSTEERVVMVKGEGCRLWDAENRSYLDATGGLWLAQIGHGRHEPAEAAARQMDRLEYFTSFWEFSNDRAIELATRLTGLAPDGIDHVYFTSGGSEGNDAAIRMARLYHHRRGETERTWILGRRAGYHGVAYGGGTVTGLPMNHDGFGPGLQHVEHLTPPWPYRTELYDGADCTDFCVRELEETIERIGAHNIAAFMGEPVMGVAGMIIPPDDYWPRIAEVLRRHGILLILDEVVTAYGRVGKWFAAEHFGISPDLIVTAKGITSGYIPLGAVLIGNHVAEVLGQEGGFPIGYTYNGHPVSCAVALANLDIIERDGLLGKAVEMGSHLGDLLRPLEELAIVGEVRQVGMMLAVEVVRDKKTREPLLPLCTPSMPDVIRQESGVIVRGGQHALVLSPPLTLSRDEAADIASGLRSVLVRTEPDGTIRD